MVTAKIPFNEFIKILRDEALENGYFYLVVLIARYADTPAIFDEVDKFWTSFHDLTGKHIVFVTSKNEERNDRIKFESGEIILPNCNVLNQLESATKFRTVDQWSRNDSEYYRKTLMEITPYKKELWKEDHTLEITEIIKSLGLKRNEVPCLYVENLVNFDFFTIPVDRLQRNYENLYSFIRIVESELYIANEKIIESLKKRRESKEIIRALERELSNHPKHNRDLIDSTNWLKDWHKRYSDQYPEVCSYVEKSINGEGNVKDVYKHIFPIKDAMSYLGFVELRRHLNRLGALANGIDENNALYSFRRKLHNDIKSNMNVLIYNNSSDFKKLKSKVSDSQTTYFPNTEIKRIRTLISKGEIGKALKFMSIFCRSKNFTEIEKLLIALESQYSTATRDNNIGVLSYVDFCVVRNRITYAILDLLLDISVPNFG